MFKTRLIFLLCALAMPMVANSKRGIGAGYREHAIKEKYERMFHKKMPKREDMIKEIEEKIREKKFKDVGQSAISVRAEIVPSLINYISNNISTNRTGEYMSGHIEAILKITFSKKGKKDTRINPKKIKTVAEMIATSIQKFYENINFRDYEYKIDWEDMCKLHDEIYKDFSKKQQKLLGDLEAFNKEVGYRGGIFKK